MGLQPANPTQSESPFVLGGAGGCTGIHGDSGAGRTATKLTDSVITIESTGHEVSGRLKAARRPTMHESCLARRVSQYAARWCHAIPSVVAALALGAGGSASAQDAYPNKVVKFVVPFSPGGPSDIIARTLADKLQASVKQRFVVENRPGAGGNVGTAAMAANPADGYTILLGVDSTFTVNPFVYASMPFKLDDLKPLMLLGSAGLTVGVHPGLGVNSLAELIAKGKVQTLNFSSGSNGSAGHLAAAILADQTGIKVNHIPYKGNAPAVTAVVAGEVQAAILGTPGFLPHVQDGRVKALAVTSLQRSRLTPTVPTVAESGIPALELEVLFITMVRTNVPDAITAVLQKAMKDALALPDVQERFTRLDLLPRGETGQSVEELLSRTRARYATIIKATGMTAD